jgi:protein-tyrosine phosphatase
MGNICRSPAAEGVLRKKLANTDFLPKIHLDSAGTHICHPNSPPDSLIQSHALYRGYDLSDLKARAIQETDFKEFDLLITMDWDNRALLEERCPLEYKHKIRGLAEFLQTTEDSVIPDPYYGGEQGFELVLDLIEEAIDGLIKFVIKKEQLSTHMHLSNFAI